jgi:hypothetical protein
MWWHLNSEDQLMKAGVRMLTGALALLLSAVAVSPAAAQEPHAEVEAVITRLFDGMRAADSAVVRSVFHPEARLATVGARAGEPVLHVEGLDAFLGAVGSPRADVWDERIWDLEVRVDGNLASAWMSYAFFVGERFSHCGVNAVQLFRGPAGWRIFQITDTRRREPCGVPDAFGR